MDLVQLVSVLLMVAGIYGALGFVFALYFVFAGAGKIDPVAAEGTKGFRLLIIPGVCLFWPLLLLRLVRGVSEPPDENNAHRLLAQGDQQ